MMAGSRQAGNIRYFATYQRLASKENSSSHALHQFTWLSFNLPIFHCLDPWLRWSTSCYHLW